jgi:hypothetical protein
MDFPVGAIESMNELLSTYLTSCTMLAKNLASIKAAWASGDRTGERFQALCPCLAFACGL